MYDHVPISVSTCMLTQFPFAVWYLYYNVKMLTLSFRYNSNKFVIARLSQLLFIIYFTHVLDRKEVKALTFV